MNLDNRNSLNAAESPSAANQLPGPAHITHSTVDSGLSGNRLAGATPRRERQSELMKIGRRVFLAGLLVSATGCKNMIRRGQSPDDTPILQLYDEKKEGPEYIGDICAIYGLNFAQVDGIGLAINLDGTGSIPKPSGQLDTLLRDLELNPSVDNPRKLVDSENTELVILRGQLPPGIRKGEPFDLEVITLGHSEATSLEGGMLLQTRLSPMRRLGKSIGTGHVMALGKGRILTNAMFETRQDEPNLKRAVVLAGGTALEDRPVGLTIRTENFSPKTTVMMSRAINSRFTTITEAGRKGVAEPKNDREILLAVPDSYRHNIARYLAVVESIAYLENANDRIARLEKLEDELATPASAGMSAVRLEALGKNGIPALTRAISNDDLEVRFHAAQALAYSGQADGVEILKNVAEVEPAFRWHAMAALASLDDVAAGIALADLMHMQSAETRYGAFRAMRARSPHDPLVTGEWLGGDFFLHEIPSDADPLMHFARTKRPEIVLFGSNQTVADDFLHVENGLTIRGNGNGTITLTKYSVEFGEEKKTCSTRVGDLVRTLANMGHGYTTIFKMFRAAKQNDMINTRLVVNAVPKLGREYTSAAGEQDLPVEKSDRYLADTLPELFRSSDQPKRKVQRVDEETVGEHANELLENRSRWEKMVDWISAGR